MNADLDWPDLNHRGLVTVRLSRANLVSLLRALDARNYGTPGLVSVDDDVVVLVVAEEERVHG